MFRQVRMNKTGFNINNSSQGERIETKVERIVNKNEPITDGAELIFTERKEGVRPEFNIRTDRFEVAIEAMDKVYQSKIAKREAKMEVIKGGDEGGNEGGKDSKAGEK